MSRGKVVMIGACSLLALATGVAPAKAERLRIPSVRQETHVWCWVAVGEMVFRHFGVANVNPARDYQCGIIGLLAVGSAAQACASNCGLCVVPAGSAEAIRSMLEEYPRRVAHVTGRRTPQIRARYVSDALSPGDVVEEIDADRPIVAGISPAGRPAGGSAHVALIVGYERGGRELIVNDPYPFPRGQNPYLAVGGQPAGRAGSYHVPHAAFRGGLNWAESFTVRAAGTIDGGVGPGPGPGQRPDPRPRLAGHCTFVGPMGPGSCPLNLSGPLPVGSPCYCDFGPGRVFSGQAR